MDKYKEILNLIYAGENQVWIRNKINLAFEENNISYEQREELLTQLSNRKDNED